MTKSSAHRSSGDYDDDRVTPDDVLEDLRSVVRDAEALLRETEGQIGDRVDDVRSRVEETLSSAREHLGDAVDEKTDRVRAAARTAEEYVRENPWTTLLIAVGVGYLIGVAGRRR